MEKIFGPEGLIASAHPDYEYRPGQIQMARAICEHCKRVLLIEAAKEALRQLEPKARPFLT